MNTLPGCHNQLDFPSSRCKAPASGVELGLDCWGFLCPLNDTDLSLQRHTPFTLVFTRVWYIYIIMFTSVCFCQYQAYRGACR